MAQRTGSEAAISHWSVSVPTANVTNATANSSATSWGISRPARHDDASRRDHAHRSAAGRGDDEGEPRAEPGVGEFGAKARRAGLPEPRAGVRLVEQTHDGVTHVV